MKNLNKHFTAITKKTDSRPILGGVHFQADRNKLVATDVYRMLETDFIGEIKNDMVLNINTMQEIDGRYPATDRIIEGAIETNQSNRVHLLRNAFSKDNVKILTSFKKSIAVLTIDKDKMTIGFQENNSSVITSPVSIELAVSSSEIVNHIAILCNCEYLRDCFAFVCDYLSDCTRETIEFNYSTDTKPFVVSSIDFTYLITPIRKKR